MSTYERIIGLLADGAWHTAEELGRVSRYPEEWLKELRSSGHTVVESEGRRLVRLVAPPPHRSSPTA